MAETTYAITGMSCDHCVQAVRAELAKLPGVLDVDVDLSSRMVRISTGEPLEGATVPAALGAAGYEVEQ